MAKRKHGQRRQRDGVIGPALRPIAWSAILGATMAAAGLSGPAYASNAPMAVYAEPGMPDRVPDSGARPTPAGLFQLPGGSIGSTPTPGLTAPPLTNTALGPLALQITTAETEVSSLGEQLKQLDLEREQIKANLTTLSIAWQDARTALSHAERSAEAAAESAYKRAAELPPGAIGSDLHGLGALSRIQKESPTGSEAEASQLKRAKEAERAAYLAYTQEESRQQAATGRYTTLQTTFRQREQALRELRKVNSSQLAAIEREREAQEQRLGAGYTGDTAAGLQAHGDAKKAVRFALAQLGEPYVWAAEGPNSWDCSGLMWGAYRSAGYSLPRVSRAQYQATKHRIVSPNALLPGDLLFFSSSRTDARKIHHVGMYIGGGKMVHAPTTGDVVKISTVWWSRFYAATRVVGAVPAPANPPSGGNTPRPKPTTPGPKPTTPGPKPTNPVTPKPTPSATTPSPVPTTEKPSDPPTPKPEDTTPPAAPDPPANTPETTAADSPASGESSGGETP